MDEDRKNNINEISMNNKGKWLNEKQLGIYLKNVLEHILEIETE